MSIATKLTKLETDITNAYSAINTKSGTIPQNKNTENLPTAISSIPNMSSQTYTYNQTNEAVRDFIDNVTYTTSYDSSSVSTYSGRSTSYNKGYPSGVNVTTTAGTLTVVDEGLDKTNNYTVSSGTNTIYNVAPTTDGGSYLVKDSNGVTSCGILKPSGNVRMIYGASLKNMRDLGGWTCDGGTVKYGKLFRGSELTGPSGGPQITADDKNMLLNMIGIRAELDMRESSESGGNETFDDSISYLWNPISNYQDAVNSEAQRAKTKIALEFIMNNAVNGVPTYYHCVAGADRTGTISWLLLGLLGVSQSDCDKEYELTCFPGPQRTRNTNLVGLPTYVMGLSGSNIKEKVLKVFRQCRVSLDLINSFRSVMSTGTPTLLTEPTASITNNLTNATNSNNSSSTTYGQTYTGTISPNTGYVLNTVTVMMNNENVTSTVYDYNTHQINIPYVYGNIVITVEAAQDQYDYVVPDLFLSVRQLWNQYTTTGVPPIDDANIYFALGVTTPNDYSYSDRSNPAKTFYLMPVDSRANKVTLDLDDTYASIDYMGYKNNNGTFTRVFREKDVNRLYQTWTAGEIDYITISVQFSEKVPWDYDLSKLKSVTFTNY